MKTKKIIFILIALALFNFLIAYYLKSLIFPFISLKYVDSEAEFNDISNLEYKIELPEEFKKFANSKNSLSGDTDPLTIIKKLTRTVRDIMTPRLNDFESYNNFLNQDNICGICSGYSQLLSGMAYAAGYKARVIWLEHHTISEIYFPGKGWIMADTNGNTVFRDKNGNLCSYIYMYKNGILNVMPERIIETVSDDPDYITMNAIKDYFNTSNIVVIEPRRHLDFSVRSRQLKNIFNYIFFNKKIAGGLQFIDSNKNINRYGNKRYLLLTTVIIDLLSLLGIVFIIVFRKTIFQKQSSF